MTYRTKLAAAVAALTLIATPALVSTHAWADGGKSGGYNEGGKSGGAAEGGKSGARNDSGIKGGR